MFGLILKDFLNLKKQLKIFGVVTVVYAFMAFTSKDASFFTSIFTMLFAILTISLYSYDELAKWDSFALTFPVSRENMVQSKYIIMLLLDLIGAVISAAFTLVLNAVLGSDTLFLGLGSVGVCSAIVLVFYSITIPFITKLGVEKARIIFFAVYIIPFVIIYLLGNAIKSGNVTLPDSLIRFMEVLTKHVYLIVPLVVILALGISYKISISFYNKKEF